MDIKLNIKAVLALLFVSLTFKALASDCTTISVGTAISSMRLKAAGAYDIESYYSRINQEVGIVYNFVPASSADITLVGNILANANEPVLLRLMLYCFVGAWRVPELLLTAENSAITDGNPVIRRAAIEALGASGLIGTSADATDVFQTLVNCWSQETDGEARAKTVLALGSIGNQYEWAKIIQSLKASIKNINNNIDTEAEGLFKSPAILSSTQESNIASILNSALNVNDYRIRMAAADAIAMRHNTDLISSLISQLGAENGFGPTANVQVPGVFYEHKVVKIKSLMALAAIGNDTSATYLIASFANEKDAEVVAGYLDTFGSIANPNNQTVLNIIAEMLNSKDELFVLHAALAAQKMHATQLSGMISARIGSVRDTYVQSRIQEVLNALAH